MKKISLLAFAFFLTASVSVAQTYEFKVLTAIESIVPMGIGRSRLIEQNENVDASQFTTARTDGKKSGQGKVERGELKIDNFNETKLLNFYSAVGINFQNIASNDALMSSKLTQMAAEGWDLAFVLSGVESKGGKDDSDGIFITRFVFKRVKK
ncbi:MAG: hypothetical protein O3C46_00255 [Bacteroidetes bacterium]|nr:hypothetical protein [Bacteroidota bacterium]MDA0930464.1 hypothetical protein [Bacteroidota bacterium]